MRLIDVKAFKSGRLKLQEFTGRDIPPYVILSHTWQDEEVLFADVQNETADRKAGFQKIKACCEKASLDGFAWAWVDTCCIDKSSSSELSEAINSMYNWYSNAVICYAYLIDVLAAAPLSPTVENTKIRLLTDSRWFTRGWTLQELIAPSAVEFYDSEWNDIGTKSSLASEIALRTGIPSRILRGAPLSSCVVAEKMSWAASRETTRIEDTAYCLMGLFSVNMPLLYGEGMRAFRRLQEQILMQEEDYSIFAWASKSNSVDGWTSSGILASSTADFSEVRVAPHRLLRQRGNNPYPRYYINHIHGHGKKHRDFTFLHPCDLPPDNVNLREPQLSIPPQLTSHGVRVKLPLKLSTDPTVPSIAWLYSHRQSTNRLLCIAVKEIKSSTYIRHLPTFLVSVGRNELRNFEMTEMFFVRDGGFGVSGSNSRPTLISHIGRHRQLAITRVRCLSKDVIIWGTERQGVWQRCIADLRYYCDGLGGGAVLLQCQERGKINYSHSIAVLVGTRNDQLWCHIVELPDDAQAINPFELNGIEFTIRSIDSGTMSDRSAMVLNSTTIIAATIRRSIHPIDTNVLQSFLDVSIYQQSEWESWPTTTDDRFLAYPEIQLRRGKLTRLKEMEYDIDRWIRRKLVKLR